MVPTRFLYPTDLRVHAGTRLLHKSGVGRVLPILLMAVFDHLILLLPSRTAGTVCYAGIHNHTGGNHHAASLKLAVHLHEQAVIDTRLDQGITETAYRRAVQNRHPCQDRKMAEGKTIVYLFLNFTIAQAIPYTYKFHAEQEHAVVTRSVQGKAFGVSRFYQSTERLPVYHLIYLVEKLGFHLALLKLQVSETQLKSLFSFQTLKVRLTLQTIYIFCTEFCRGL